MTEEDALAFIVNMQQTNGGCKLPCWWGITPGETSAQIAAQILSPLRKFKGLRSEYGFHLEDYSDIDVVLVTGGGEQPIDEIWIYSTIPFEDESTRYHESWRRYFVDGLLNELGVPSDVWLGFGQYTEGRNQQAPVSGIVYFELYLIYSNQGIAVRYMGPAARDGLYRACPSLNQLNDILMFISGQTRGPLPGPLWDPFTEAHPVSEVTDLSLETFYESFKNPNNQACLESETKYWP